MNPSNKSRLGTRDSKRETEQQGGLWRRHTENWIEEKVAPYDQFNSEIPQDSFPAAEMPDVGK